MMDLKKNYIQVRSPSFRSGMARLLYKLKTLNTPTAIFKLIKYYLSARCFRINEITSETKQINAGVPQD